MHEDENRMRKGKPAMSNSYRRELREAKPYIPMRGTREVLRARMWPSPRWLIPHMCCSFTRVMIRPAVYVFKSLTN